MSAGWAAGLLDELASSRKAAGQLALPPGADRLVRDLLARGLNVAEIAAETGLTPEDVEALA